MTSAISLAALLVLALALAAPVAGQEETTGENQTGSKGENASGQRQQSVQGSGQQDGQDGAPAATPTRASDPLQDAAVTTRSTGDTLESIEIAATDCTVEKGATVTVAEEESGTAATFVDGDVADVEDIVANISSTQGQVVIDDFDTDSLDGSEDLEVTDSTGIRCGRAANNDDDAAETVDELLDLSCDDLLELFRAEGSAQQYADGSGFADSEVRAQVEVCLEEEIVQGTAADENLPNTGGFSLIGLAVLGVVSAAAGLSVIRGSRR